MHIQLDLAILFLETQRNLLENSQRCMFKMYYSADCKNTKISKNCINLFSIDRHMGTVQCNSSRHPLKDMKAIYVYWPGVTYIVTKSNVVEKNAV